MSRLTDYGPQSGTGFDEFRDPDGQLRPGWRGLSDSLDGVEPLVPPDAHREVERLLTAYGVTYTPSPAAEITLVDDAPEDPPATGTEPWQLDVAPVVLDDVEWRTIERGLTQRAELLNAVLQDLYSGRTLLRDGLLPPELVYTDPEFLRPAVGLPAAALGLLLVGADLGRDADGAWTVVADRVQAPSGAGYAMQNRRILSRVLPEVFHQAPVRRLTPFFQTLRSALVNATPGHVDDPRIVVLSPGARSETAFDQAFLASMLGFPLIEGSDLTVRDGKVWMRVADDLEQVDVILRRVDSAWVDPLELRAGSRLGSAGLLECVRHGSVRVLNPVGSGLLENPALMAFLPRLCETLLGESLRLDSVPTFWCADDTARSHVLANLDTMVVRSTSRDGARSVRGQALSGAERDELAARIEAAPHTFVGQLDLPLSTSPTVGSDGVQPGRIMLRPFAVADGSSFQVMPGGLGRAGPPERSGRLLTGAGDVSKDVWVLAPERAGAGETRPATGAEPVLPRASVQVALVPRVLDDLYWVGRYAERAEDLVRLVLATEPTSSNEAGSPVQQAEAVLLRALARVSGSGLTLDDDTDGRAVLTFLRQHVLAAGRDGTFTQSVNALRDAALGVRDQLSGDVWLTLAQIDAALAHLRRSRGGPAMVSSCENALTGLLALSGVISENMVRDTGWYLLDIGRGLERALQVVRLLRVTVVQPRDGAVERQVLESVLTACESIITHRRRYRGRLDVLTTVDLLVLDASNPRSVAYQVERIRRDLEHVSSTRSVQSLREVTALGDLLTRADLLEPAGPGPRELLDARLAALADGLTRLSGELRHEWMRPPPTLQQMPQGLVSQ